MQYLFLKYNLTYFKTYDSFLDTFIISRSGRRKKKAQKKKMQLYVHVCLDIYRRCDKAGHGHMAPRALSHLRCNPKSPLQ